MNNRNNEFKRYIYVLFILKLINTDQSIVFSLMIVGYYIRYIVQHKDFTTIHLCK